MKFCSNADAIVRERDIHHRIKLCTEGLEMLKEFLAPYRLAGWPPPEELPCVYWSIHDYMALGEWEKAEDAVKVCVEAGAFSADEGIEQLKKLRQTADASSATLRFLSENPGTLQRNIYRKLCPPCDRDALKWFLANSVQIRKEKVEKTNRLFTAEGDPQSDGGSTV